MYIINEMNLFIYIYIYNFYMISGYIDIDENKTTTINRHSMKSSIDLNFKLNYSKYDCLYQNMMIL